jgi:intracellular septation protein
MKAGAAIQLSYEFAPVVAFFVAGQIFSFTGAVLALLITTSISLCIAWTYHRQVPLIPLASGALVIITGALTVFFNKPDAIILADTIYFWGLAVAIAAGFRTKKHVLERMFDKTFAITHKGWKKLSLRWMFVLIIAGIGNEYVRIFMTPEFWIDYRFTKILLIMLFSIYQFRLAKRYRIAGESTTWGLRANN